MQGDNKVCLNLGPALGVKKSPLWNVQQQDYSHVDLRFDFKLSAWSQEAPNWDINSNCPQASGASREANAKHL